MNALMSWLQDHETLLWVTSMASLILFLATLVFIPLFISRLPADYFTRHDRTTLSSSRNTMLFHLGLLCKNIIGVLLILVGIAMLVLPGQGVLTILIGLTLTHFPGKRRLELHLIRQRPVFRALNWIRRKTGQPPLLSP